MATAKDFVVRISNVKGVSGCLLIKTDGTLVGRSVEDPESYTTLMQISGGLSQEIKAGIGASYCRCIDFGCMGSNNFYVFPIDSYLLGVVAQPEAEGANMMNEIYRLIGRVTTGNS